MQIDAFNESQSDQRRLQQPRVIKTAAAFGGAHVDPHARLRFRSRFANRLQDRLAIPPDRWRQRGDAAEHRRVIEARCSETSPPSDEPAMPVLSRSVLRAIGADRSSGFSSSMIIRP